MLRNHTPASRIFLFDRNNLYHLTYRVQKLFRKNYTKNVNMNLQLNSLTFWHNNPAGWDCKIR